MKRCFIHSNFGKDRRNACVFIKATGDCYFNSRTFFAYFYKGLSSRFKKNNQVKEEGNSDLFDVENERYSYLNMLLKSGISNRSEHWIFCKNKNKSMAIKMSLVLNSLFLKDKAIAFKFIPVDAMNVPVKIELDKNNAIFFVNGSADKSMIWRNLYLLLRQKTNCKIVNYPVYYFPWNFSDIQRNWYDLYFYDEDWQKKEMLSRFEWASEENLHEMVKIPNYSRIFYGDRIAKKWDVCMPSLIKEGKNQLEILEASKAAAIILGRKINCCIVGGISLRGRRYCQKLYNFADRIKNHVKVDFISRQKREKLARIIRQSRIVAIGSMWDASPRVIQEAICCNVPVLANIEMLCGKKYLYEKTGVLSPIDKFDISICDMLGNLEKFDPRNAFLSEWNPSEVSKLFVDKINRICRFESRFYS